MKIDARKKACPQPVILTIKALKELSEGDQVATTVDNQTAVENLKRLGQEKGCQVEVKEEGADYTVILTPPSGGVQMEDRAEVTWAEKAGGRDTVVVVGTDAMGQGNDDLGKILIKSFLYSLTQLEELPSALIFFNGGVKLTTAGSPSLEDLKKLAEEGVKIISCGTCLDYYAIKDQLEVGIVSNMYEIASTMQVAGKVIRI